MHQVSLAAALSSMLLVIACAADDADDAVQAQDPPTGASSSGAATTTSSGDASRVPDAAAVDAATSLQDAGIEADAAADAEVDAAPPFVGTAGCGHAATPGVTTETITVGALTRTYLLSVPAGYDPDVATPVVYGWHGQGGSATQFRGGGTGYGGLVEKAAAGAAIFVYPLGTIREQSKTGWQIDANVDGIDVAFFDAMYAKINGSLCVDPGHVFSYGHSYGARMSNQLGCLRGDKLRGIAPVSGYGPLGTGRCVAGTFGVWLHNAADDNVVDPAWGVATRNYWAGQHCDDTATASTTPTPCVSYQHCDDGAPITWCEPTTGGHGFSAYVGPAIWSFFASLD